MANVRGRETLMTAPDVAEYLQVTLRYVYILEKEKGLPMFKLGREWRCKRRDLLKWVNDRQSESK
jgi:excisionase family DNA binding protein